MKPIGPIPKDIWHDARGKISMKTLKRCHKPASWIHYLNGDITACGEKDTYRLHCGPHMTSRLPDVTCPRCIESLKKTHWYCPKHGFINDEHVTFQETCDICGEYV